MTIIRGGGGISCESESVSESKKHYWSQKITIYAMPAQTYRDKKTKAKHKQTLQK